MPKCSLNRRASSPIVMPWRIGIGYMPDERLEAGHEHRPFDLRAADRVRPVADDDLERRACAPPSGSSPSCRCRCRCACRRPAGRSRARRGRAASRPSARASRCRASRPARGGPRRARAASRSCCPARRTGTRAAGPKIAVSRALGCASQPVGDVAQAGVDRRRVADDPDAAAVEAVRRQQTVASEQQRHFTIIGGPALASDQRALIDYPPLVVSPACFARAESRSSLKSDSLPPCDRCSRAADVQQPPGSGT